MRYSRLVFIFAIVLSTASLSGDQKTATAPNIPSSFSPTADQGRNSLDQGMDGCPGTSISSLPYSDTGTTLAKVNNFTQCGPNTAPDVIYRHTPSTAGLHTVSLCGSFFDTRLEIRTGGTCPGTTQIACNNDVCGMQSMISTPLSASQQCWIIVDGNESASGDYTMNMYGPCTVPYEPSYEMECGEVPGPNHYYEDCDGGCNVMPPLFGSIMSGQTVYGRAFTYTDPLGNNRQDTDWYEFYVMEPSIVTLRVQAEFPATVAIVDYHGCTSPEFIVSKNMIPHCLADSVTSGTLAPGVYAAYIAPMVTEGMDGLHNYAVSLRMAPAQYQGGTIELSMHDWTFPPTYMSMMSMTTIFVTNTHLSQTLQVDSITTTGHVWGANPSGFMLMPGQMQPVMLTFQPSFEHDFEGFIEVYSSDHMRPRDSVTVAGIGCKPAEIPPPPMLYDAASPSDIYFALPWDNNGESAEYLIEYSADGFITSDSVEYFFPGSDPFMGTVCFATAGDWGEGGNGVISELEPSTAYQVRLRVRDCTGYTVYGPPAMMHTAAPLAPSAYRELTIRVVNADTLELNWNPDIKDTLGNPLPNMGDLIYAGSEYGVSDSVVGWCTTGTLRVPLEENQKGFFYVESVLEGVYDRPSPFIAWPPEGALVCGMNTVEIHDFAHFCQWDSFRVEIDSFGYPALIGSSFDNPWSFEGRRMAVGDFNNYGLGPHNIMVTVVDKVGRSWGAFRGVTVVPKPFATFDAVYDSIHQIFRLDTVPMSLVTPGPLLDIYWPTSTAGERYGGTVNFDWNTTRDSVTIVKPIPKCSLKVVSNEQPAPLKSDPVIAVVPQTSSPKRTPAQVGFCCVSLTVTPEQPYVGCPHGPGLVTVGVPFHVDIQWKAIENGSQKSHGQDAKGDRTYTYGKCKGQPPTFDPNPSSPSSPNPIVQHKRYKGKDYARDSLAWGDDDYHADRHDKFLRTDTRKNTTWWHDFPRDQVYKPSGLALRVEGHNAFKSWARVKCPTEPVGACCKLFEVDWDIVCCKNGDVITNTAPNLSGLRPCPDE
jgi:hypothetical protein